jgi:hypothetical protein
MLWTCGAYDAEAAAGGRVTERGRAAEAEAGSRGAPSLTMYT